MKSDVKASGIFDSYEVSFQNSKKSYKDTYIKHTHNCIP